MKKIADFFCIENDKHLLKQFISFLIKNNCYNEYLLDIGHLLKENKILFYGDCFDFLTSTNRHKNWLYFQQEWFKFLRKNTDYVDNQWERIYHKLVKFYPNEVDKYFADDKGIVINVKNVGNDRFYFLDFLLPIRKCRLLSMLITGRYHTEYKKGCEIWLTERYMD